MNEILRSQLNLMLPIKGKLSDPELRRNQEAKKQLLNDLETVGLRKPNVR
jgi:hypothetical protein